jgi:uncharacterized RDD family membrane protein YckC
VAITRGSRRPAEAALDDPGGTPPDDGSTNVYAYLRSSPGARYQSAMADREPALLTGGSGDDRLPATGGSGSEPAPASTPEPATAREPAVARETLPPRPRREAASVFVVGFWRRLAAAMIDLAIVLPCALLITVIASRITGVQLPPSNLRMADIDLWIDLVLAADPSLVMALVLFGAIGLTYLLVFQIVLGRTLGMRVLRIKIIDVYGDRPSAGRCVARCAGYLAGVATMFLGFLWIGFDSEKRGLQDWIAGTYVIRARE